MSDIAELQRAFMNAHNAGDKRAAQVLATELNRIQAHEAMSAGAKGVRAVEMGAQGIMESAADTLGAVPDLLVTGARKVGIPDAVLPPENYYSDALKRGYRAVGETLSAPLNTAIGHAGGLGAEGPQSALERGAYGAGRGVADAASFMVPGAGLAKFARVGSTGQRVGRAMMAQPALQVGAGAVGGATTEVTENPWLGLAASLGTAAAPSSAMHIARKLRTPFPSQLKPYQKVLAEAAKREGIELTPAQLTKSPFMLKMEQAFRQLPFTSNRQNAIYDAQRTAYNRSVLETAGIHADDARPEVIEGAFQRIGGMFDDLVNRTTVKVDQKLFDDVAQSAEEYGRRLPTDMHRTYQSYVDDIMSMMGHMQPQRPNPGNLPALPGRSSEFVTVEIPGQAYQNISSDLRTAAREATGPLKRALLRLMNNLDDTLQRSGGDELRDAWDTTRRQYRNLLTIDKAIGGGTGETRSAADIAYGSLKAAVKSMDKTGYGRGRGDLNELSRIGDLMGALTPRDSGTPLGNKVMGFLTGGTAAAPTLAAAGGFVDPATAAAIYGAGLGLPKTIQGIYMNPTVQRYLSNQAIQPGPSREAAALLAKVLAAQGTGQATEN